MLMRPSTTSKRIAIIGGGAAGLMAAATLVEAGSGRPANPAAGGNDAHAPLDITLFERNPRLGAKVLISGGGRCNVTTGLTDIAEVLSRYPRGSRFLRHAMHRFPPAAVATWFAMHGVPLKTEPDLRVFPRSDNGRDVVAVFERLFAAGGLRVLLGTTVTAITVGDDGFMVSSTPTKPSPGRRQQPSAGPDETEHAERHRPFAAVILTTGGSAYRHTGSQGDGYRFAAALGHTITALHPSLNAYVVQEPWAGALAGLSFTDAVLELPARRGGETLPARGAGKRGGYRFRGPFLFTHVGVTGPAVFALCSLAAAERFDAAHPLPLRINLQPDHSTDSYDQVLQQRFAALGGRQLVNALDTLLPRSLCPLLCELAGIDPALPVARLPRSGRRRLAELATALPLTVIGRRNGEEFVTAGGVATNEVEPRTMASRLVPGLYFAGEILDVDGFTGGFNLQAAWCTGRLAGETAVGRWVGEGANNEGAAP